MAITLDLTSIKLSNHILIRNEVDRLRTKLGISAYSWSALGGGSVSASDWNNTRAGVAAFSGNQYVGTLNLSSMPTKTATTDLVTSNEYNGAVDLLSYVDSVCVVCSNYSDCAYCAYYSDYSNQTVWNDIGVLSNAGFSPNYTLN